MKKIILLFALVAVVLSSLSAKAEISDTSFTADITNALTQNGYTPKGLKITTTLGGMLNGQVSDLIAKDENVIRKISFASGNFNFSCLATVRVHRTQDRQVFIYACDVETKYEQLIPGTMVN